MEDKVSNIMINIFTLFQSLVQCSILRLVYAAVTRSLSTGLHHH